jgi:hypothetical protein
MHSTPAVLSQKQGTSHGACACVRCARVCVCTPTPRASTTPACMHAAQQRRGSSHRAHTDMYILACPPPDQGLAQTQYYSVNPQGCVQRSDPDRGGTRRRHQAAAAVLQQEPQPPTRAPDALAFLLQPPISTSSGGGSTGRVCQRCAPPPNRCARRAGSSSSSSWVLHLLAGDLCRDEVSCLLDCADLLSACVCWCGGGVAVSTSELRQRVCRCRCCSDRQRHCA